VAKDSAGDSTKIGPFFSYLSAKNKDTKAMTVAVKAGVFLDGKLSITLNAPVKSNAAGDVTMYPEVYVEGGFNGLLSGNTVINETVSYNTNLAKFKKAS
jgi:hypothetical protein